jgi:hypothetical protein
MEVSRGYKTVALGSHRIRYSYILMAAVLLAAHPPIATADERGATPPVERALVMFEDGDLACELVELDESAAKSLGLAQDHALLVVLPAKDGPAEKAGLKPGDVVIDINEQPASKLDEFSATVKRIGSGGEVKLGVWRQGDKTLLPVRLGSANGGTRAGSIEQEIEAYKAIGKVFEKRDFPAIWGFIQYKLGEFYWIRIEGSSEDNLETALASYNSALTVLTKEAFPQQWARTEKYLALAYMDRIHGSRAENLEAAIRAHKAALAVMTREKSSREWAQIQNALGLAYMDRAEGSHEDNVDAAIEAYKATLTVLTKEAFPQDWARTQKNLGVAYRGRRRGDKADNLEAAVKAYEAALTVSQRVSSSAPAVAVSSLAPVKCEAQRAAQGAKTAVAAKDEPQAPEEKARTARHPAETVKKPPREAEETREAQPEQDVKAIAQPAAEKAKSAAQPDDLNKAPGEAEARREAPRSEQESKTIAAPVAAKEPRPAEETAKPVRKPAEESKKELEKAEPKVGGAQQSEGETKPAGSAEANAPERRQPVAKEASQVEPRADDQQTGNNSAAKNDDASKKNDRKTRKRKQLENGSDELSARMRDYETKMKSKCGGSVVWIDRRSNTFSAGTYGYGLGRGRFACR